jgi:iron complex transport system permease protein
VVAYVLFDFSSTTLIWFGTAGGLLAAVITLVISWRTQLHPVHLTLAGMSVAVFCASAIMVFLVLAANEANGLYFWLIGGFADRTVTHFMQLLPWTVAGLCLGLLFSRQLNLLMLDDAVCQALGVSVFKWRLMTGLVAVVLTAASVAVAGPIGFVGLIAPHIVHLIFGTLSRDHRFLLPMSALVGATLIGLADLVAKINQMPAGIVTALVGGPWFIYLIARQGRKT